MWKLLRAVGTIGCAVAAAIGIAGAASAAPGAAAAACTGTLQVTSLAFDPSSVSPGESSTLILAAQNCTGQSIPVSVEWYGLFQGGGGTFPGGCYAIDPLVKPDTVPASGTYTAGFGFTVNPQCTATSLTATVRVWTADGTVLVNQTASLTIIPPSGACAITYVRQSEWPGGFIANITVHNAGATAINGWSLTFTFAGDQTITSVWGALVTQTGAAVTATNASYDGTIPPGGSVSFGIQGTWQNRDYQPVAFTLNGTSCPLG